MDRVTAPASPGRVLISGGASGLGRAAAVAVRDAGGMPIVLNIAGAPGGDMDGMDTEITDVGDTRAAVPRCAPRGTAARQPLDAVLTAARTDHPAPFGSLADET